MRFGSLLLVPILLALLSCQRRERVREERQSRVDAGEVGTTTVTGADLPPPAEEAEMRETPTPPPATPPQEEDEPVRGADRYSIIHAPNLEENLGMGEGGAAVAPSPAPPPAPAPPPRPSPQERRVGPPSAADPRSWTGTNE